MVQQRCTIASNAVPLHTPLNRSIRLPCTVTNHDHLRKDQPSKYGRCSAFRIELSMEPAFACPTYSFLRYKEATRPSGLCSSASEFSYLYIALWDGITPSNNPAFVGLCFLYICSSLRLLGFLITNIHSSRNVNFLANLAEQVYDHISFLSARDQHGLGIHKP